MKDKCVWCGSDKELVQHHVSYKPEITITLCKRCHASRHFDYGKCGLCKQKERKPGEQSRDISTGKLLQNTILSYNK